MKRIFSILLTLTILAGLTAIPAFASTDAGTVYFYNDFSSTDSTDKLENIGTVVGETDTQNGVFKLSNGTVKANNTEYTGKNAYVSIPYEEGEKPNLCVEYKLTPYDLKGNNSASTNRFIYTNTHSIDTVFIGGLAIDADSTSDNTATNDIALVSANTNNASHTIKILYSATQNIRTIYVDGKCLGTFDNKATDKAWSEDTSGAFHFALVKNKQASGCNPTEVDYIKISKLTDKMINVSLQVEDGVSLPTGTKNSLWIPEGEKVNLNLYVADGKTLSVKLNDETYIDSFTSDYSYTTPSLNENDTITIFTNDVETDFAAYTKPYVFQYTRDDGYKAVVILGRMVEVAGYTSDSYGIFYSMVNPDVTPTAEGVHAARLRANDERVVDGNFAIELYHPDLKTGDKIYYKSYAYYQNVNDETDKPQAFGEVNTIVIE
ncbi:MAG: hypothetical protein E7419_03215 [Ruminococcaceae bacterium]|nr:hypothetical protein [Oscillospiraceae bacterium]